MTRGRRCSLRRTASRWKVEWAALEDAVVVFSKDVKCIPVCDVGASRDEALGSQGSAFASFTLRLCPASDHTLIHPRPPRLANQISFVRATGFGLETYCALGRRKSIVCCLPSAVCCCSRASQASESQPAFVVQLLRIEKHPSCSRPSAKAVLAALKQPGSLRSTRGVSKLVAALVMSPSSQNRHV